MDALTSLSLDSQNSYDQVVLTGNNEEFERGGWAVGYITN